MPKSNFITEIPINNWNELLNWYEANKDKAEWLFRGQKEHHWPLETSLERIAKRFGVNLNQLPSIEDKLLKRFKRQCHHYITSLPAEDDKLEWLALMQHYGAPTRLQDWTHSLFVGIYFALESAENESAVWALDHNGLNNAAISSLPLAVQRDLNKDRNLQQKKTFKEVFERKKGLVLSVKPYRFNDRLVVQQGTFLCPSDITKPFEDNLDSALSKSAYRQKLIKLVITGNQGVRKEILKRLNHMNMNASTLFPGLGGFAQSLGMLMAFPEYLST